MITIKAKIRLYKHGGRTTPFSNHYRPIFEFNKKGCFSGQIELLGREDFPPDSEGVVMINFLHEAILDIDFKVGKKFTFGEGKTCTGEGVILEIISKKPEVF